MTLSEFIEDCQAILKLEGDGEIKINSWSITGDNYRDPEIVIEEIEGKGASYTIY